MKYLLIAISLLSVGCVAQASFQPFEPAVTKKDLESLVAQLNQVLANKMDKPKVETGAK